MLEIATLPTPVTHVLYLHGFRSSPRSTKCQQTHAWVRAREGVVWAAPQLAPSPAQAYADIEARVRGWPMASSVVFGSSLGGHYATRLAHDHGLRAVLINPAVHPARDLAAYIGQQTQWHAPEDSFYFEHRYVDELQALACGPLAQPERVLLLASQGDEVLDWQEMRDRYVGAIHDIRPGGNHAMDDYATRWPLVAHHLGWEGV